MEQVCSIDIRHLLTHHRSSCVQYRALFNVQIGAQRRRTQNLRCVTKILRYRSDLYRHIDICCCRLLNERLSNKGVAAVVFRKGLSSKRKKEIPTFPPILRQLLEKALHSGLQLRVTELIRSELIALENLYKRGIKSLV